jgi:hypothetical protein
MTVLGVTTRAVDDGGVGDPIHPGAASLANPIRAEPAAGHGVNQHTAGGDNVTSSDRGNAPTYALRRLKRDRPDLAALFNAAVVADALQVIRGAPTVLFFTRVKAVRGAPG